MDRHNKELFSFPQEFWSKLNLPLTPEATSNTNSTELNDDNFIQSLLSVDETIWINNLESNHVKFSKKCEENEEYVNESWFDENLNKSRFAEDVLSQRNYEHLSSNRANNEFELHNSYNNDQLTTSVLKKKLLSSHAEDGISVKRRCIDLNKNDVSKSFYGLPEKVQNLIKECKGIDKLYDWQEECLKICQDRIKNLIYALPTSGGKTLVAEILMLREIVNKRKNAIFILPFVALVQEKIQSMTPFALEFNFLIEEYAAGKGQYPPRKRRKKNSLYVCTIEKAQTIINCLIELNRLDEIGIIVVDELHLLGENGGRGASLECLLTKVMFSQCNIQIIGMSATIGNLEEIALFLNAEIYVQNFRPIHITEYVKCGNEIWLIDPKQENIFTDKKIINYKYTETAQKRDPDFLAGLVMDVVPKDSCLIFCSTKKNCENVTMLLTDVLHDKEKEFKNYKVDEKLTLLNALQSECGQICPVLKKTVQFGFAYHHSGLTAEERRLLEEAFRSGVLCVICCTSTLAAGVNLPARRVILRSPYVGSQFLTNSRYKQIIGRAGRAGLGEIGESILVCSKNDIQKVRALFSSKIDDSVSSLHIEKDRGINNLIISAVFLSEASTRGDIHKIVSKTLMKVQESRLGISVKEVTDEALKTLMKNDILRVKGKNSTKSYSQLDDTDILKIEKNEDEVEIKKTEKQKKNTIILTNSTQLELCPLGKAAMKGSIDVQTAYKLYHDLKKAQKNLILEDHLHLLYLITPYEIASQVKPVGVVYYDVYHSLAVHQMQLARFLGINEAVMAKIRGGKPTTPNNTGVVQRFYVTLMLYELWQQQSIHNVAEKYQVDRGTIQNLLSSAASFSSSAVRFCQEIDEFWTFKNLLMEFGQKLTYSYADELEPLMELPFVKTGRAMQLYKAGYKTVQLIARADPEEMVNKIKHLSRRVATQIISAAMLLILEKAENLHDELEGFGTLKI